MKKILFCFFLANLIITIRLNAQELDPFVMVNVEQVPLDNRIFASTMLGDVTTYLKSQRFVDADWEGPKIPVEVSIYLSGGSNGNFSAKVFIISKRTIDGPVPGTSVALRLVDDKLSFQYAQFANLSYNPTRFHEFTSLLDFYMLLIIGFDMDTYGELDGTPVYQIARNICQLGDAAGADGYGHRGMPGDFTRYNLVSELMDIRYEILRRMFFSYYVDGLDMMAADKDKGTAAVIKFIADLVDYKKNKMTGPSVLLQAFFDAKYGELSEMFRTHPDKERIFNDLIFVDPSHTTDYNDARSGK